MENYYKDLYKLVNFDDPEYNIFNTYGLVKVNNIHSNSHSDYSPHSNSHNNYSRGGSYLNWTEAQWGDWSESPYSQNDHNNHHNGHNNKHTNNTTNYSPKFTSGSLFPSSGTFNRTVNLDWSAAVISKTVVSFNIYKKVPADASAWVLVCTTPDAAKTYSIDTSDYPAGTVKFCLTAWDGKEHSAVFSNGAFTDPTGTTASTLEGGILTISHYAAPEWTNVILPDANFFKAFDVEEAYSQYAIIKESFGFDTEVPSFGTIDIDKRATAKADLEKLQNIGNQLLVEKGEEAFEFTLPVDSVVQDKTLIQGRELMEVRELIEEFE